MHRQICTLLLLITANVALGGTVDPPMRIKVLKLDKSELSGVITSYSADDFTVVDAKKVETKVTWDLLPPDVVFNLNDRLMSPRKVPAEDWFKLGQKLLTMPGGRAPAGQAFARAVRIDPKLKDQIAAAKKEANVSTEKVGPTPAGLNGRNDGRMDSRSTQPVSTQPASPFDPRDPEKKVLGPQVIGAIDPNAWGKQTADETKQSIEKLKAFGAETNQKLGTKCTLYETQYFLFYSDLPAADAQNWAGVLDRMYLKLSLLFGIPNGENLWHGKALVLVFGREEDYLKFEIKMHQTIAAGTAGMCHAFGSGDVHIAFYRQPNEMDFAHVLVHESVHGFLHRYRSAIDVPSWANEGLAEAIATDMVPRKGIAQSALADARGDLQSRKSLDDFFTTDHIVAWQYPVARTLTEFMIRSNKQGYVDFINGIKDGLKWDEALKTKYGVSTDQLVNAYGNSMGVAGLKAGEVAETR